MAELNPLPESLPQFTKERGKEEEGKKDALQKRLPRVSYTSAEQTEISKRPGSRGSKIKFSEFYFKLNVI